MLSGVVCAQDAQEYQGWMKTVAGTAGSLRKNIQAQNGSDTAKDAQKLSETFQQVQSYWEKNNASDAVNFAKTARDASEQLAQAASAGKWDDAAAQLKTVQGTCAGCHAAHREGAAGSFKIK